jgi:DNA-binding NarL/FixJ family response regulator
MSRRGQIVGHGRHQNAWHVPRDLSLSFGGRDLEAHESPGVAKPRVVIADDHQLVVAALKALLAEAHEVVETVYDGDTLVPVVERLKPHIVLLDIFMPPNGGLQNLANLRKLDPQVGVIVVTMSEDIDLAAQALKLGASGYVLKSAAPSALLEAMRRVMNREIYVTPQIAGGIINSLTKPSADRGTQLSDKQREVLRLLAQGKSMKEAASELNVAVTTVSFHKYRMMKQLNITTTAGLIRFAVAKHIV